VFGEANICFVGCLYPSCLSMRLFFKNDFDQLSILRYLDVVKEIFEKFDLHRVL